MQRRILHEKVKHMISDIGKVIIGQDYMINRLLMGLFTDGHVLLEGVPGLAKTLTINTLAKVLCLNFKRIQFTPDLLPADLVGTMIYNPKESNFEVKKGPIFANLILADEVNRSPAKVQSALLECMQERQVTIGEKTYILDSPFLVLATQNPIEQEGTYPLPEAQVDRFMMKISINYPSKDSELEIVRRMSNTSFQAKLNEVLNKEDIFSIGDIINHTKIKSSLEEYIVELVFATRNPQEYGLKEESGYVQFGASPRAGINMHRAAKALAFMDDREYVLPEDIKDVAHDILNHRIILNYEAEADGITVRHIIDKILSKVDIKK